MIQELLSSEHSKETDLNYEFWKIIKIASTAFVIAVTLNIFGDPPGLTIDDISILILTNAIMSLSITTIPSLSGLLLRNKVSDSLSLGLRSLISFFTIIFSLIVGIFLGEWIILSLGILHDSFIGIEDSFWILFVFSSFIAAVAVTYFGFKEKLIEVYEELKEQERQKAELEILKSRAEFEALQAKINPHFLFNSLNSIAGLCSIDGKKAEQMSLKLAELFRSTLKLNDDSFPTLKEEVKQLNNYLDIEKIRFGKRLNFRIELDESLENQQIPQLLIQPIVENAIKHGIEALTENGQIDVSIQKKDDRILILVSDNGKGLDGAVSFGYGLTNIQKRLENIYKDDFSFDLKSENGVNVSIDIPLKQKT